MGESVMMTGSRYPDTATSVRLPSLDSNREGSGSPGNGRQERMPVPTIVVVASRHPLIAIASQDGIACIPL